MNISIIISIVALSISIFTIFKNYLQPFKLFVNKDKYLFWVFTDGTLRLDLGLFFFNAGMRAGLIDYVELNLGDEIILVPEFIYGLDNNENLSVKELWQPFILSGKQGIHKFVGFKSKINFDSFNEKQVDIRIRVKYINKFRNVESNYYIQDTVLEFNKTEALGRSKRYREIINKDTDKK
jgi:hypothetical protein